MIAQFRLKAICFHLRTRKVRDSANRPDRRLCTHIVDTLHTLQRTALMSKLIFIVSLLIDWNCCYWKRRFSLWGLRGAQKFWVFWVKTALPSLRLSFLKHLERANLFKEPNTVKTVCHSLWCDHIRIDSYDSWEIQIFAASLCWDYRDSKINSND